MESFVFGQGTQRRAPAFLRIFRGAARSNVPAAAVSGLLASGLRPGAVSHFGHGNALTPVAFSGRIESVACLPLFRGAYTLAVEAAPGSREIIQAGTLS